MPQPKEIQQTAVENKSLKRGNERKPTKSVARCCHAALKPSTARRRTNGGNGGDDFSELQLVKDGSFASSCASKKVSAAQRP